MKDNERVKDITSTVGYILGCIVLVMAGLFCLGWFTGCSGDSGTSVPSRICYDKELGYSDVVDNEDYYGEWMEAACVVRIGDDCVSYDNHATIVKHVCLENVDYEPRSKGTD